MAASVSQFLPRFSGNSIGGGDILERIKQLGAVETEKRTADLVAEAEERGRQEGDRAARAEFEKIRAGDLAAFDARLVEARRQTIEEIAGDLPSRMDAVSTAFETAVSDHVARALSKFVGQAARDRAVSELSQILAALKHEQGAIRIRIAGPEALIDALKTRGLPTGAECHVAPESVDLTVTVDDTVIETRLSAWANKIGGAAAGLADE